MTMMTANSAVKRRIFLIGILATFWLAPTASAPASGISERVFHDPLTGIAIGGFDPVAYFTDGMPRRGSPDHEIYWAGGYWRFVSEGNQAAFEAAPEAFAPAYGGHGLVGMAGGFAQESNPELFAIHRNRLFLFYRSTDLPAFRQNPDAMVNAADAAWSRVSATLAD